MFAQKSPKLAFEEDETGIHCTNPSHDLCQKLINIYIKRANISCLTFII